MRQGACSGTLWETWPSSQPPTAGTGSLTESPTTRLSGDLQEGGSGHQARNSAEPCPPLWAGQHRYGTWVWPALRLACSPVALCRRRSGRCGRLISRHWALRTRYTSATLSSTSQSPPFSAGAPPGTSGVSVRAPAPVSAPPYPVGPYRLPRQPAPHAESHTHAGVGRLVGRGRLRLSADRQSLGCAQPLAGTVCLD